MNERIRELAKMHGFVNEHMTPGEKSDALKKYEKFAELIVKECGHCMVDIMLHGGIEPEQGYDIMMKHFGVEE